jgi:hypothetical protein
VIDQIFIKKRFSWKKTTLVVFLSATIVLILEKILHLNFIIPFFNNLRLSYVLPYYLSFYLRNYWPFIVLAIIALFSAQNKFKKESYFLIVAFLAYLFPLSFLTNIVNYRYLFHVAPILFVLASVAIVYICQQIQKNYQKIIFVLAVILVFFTIGGGVIWPTNAYYLESDNPETLGKRPHYAYTPQPDWNGAYAFIQTNKKNTDIVISSLPQFNKIFLGEAGYWIKYNYLGIKDEPNIVENDREYYVGAKVINDLAELQSIARNNHGYIVFDYMATDGRITNDILKYINDNFTEVFYEKTNFYSQIWVYAF